MTADAASSAIERLAATLVAAHARLVTAESCTGGLIAAACTALAGSSAWFERGFVVYSDAAKTELLGVAEATIAAHGAVSGEVARAMAEGALARAGAHLAVAVTGIGGPSGGTEGKPVGTVWIAVAGALPHVQARPRSEAFRFAFTGDRSAVRAAAVEQAIALVAARCASVDA